MRRLRSFEEAGKDHALLLLPPLGHRVYFVAAESNLELGAWETALLQAGMRQVPSDDEAD